MCQPSECAKFSWHSYKNHNNSTKLSQNNFIYSELSSSKVSITIGHVRELWPVALQLPQRRARVSVLGCRPPPPRVSSLLCSATSLSPITPYPSFTLTPPPPLTRV